MFGSILLIERQCLDKTSWSFMPDMAGKVWALKSDIFKFQGIL